MENLVWLVAGYILGAYLMRRHMLRSIRAAAQREVAQAMIEYERGLLRRIGDPAACGRLSD